jgi:hypothetical protein
VSTLASWRYLLPRFCNIFVTSCCSNRYREQNMVVVHTLAMQISQCANIIRTLSHNLLSCMVEKRQGWIPVSSVRSDYCFTGSSNESVYAYVQFRRHLFYSCQFKGLPTRIIERTSTWFISLLYFAFCGTKHLCAFRWNRQRRLKRLNVF